MTVPIVRLYETQKQARDAATKLADGGFPADSIFLVLAKAEPDEDAMSALASALSAGTRLRRQFDEYARELAAGHSLVAVHAAFGTGRDATDIMESCDPVQVDVGSPSRASADYGPGAPLSAAMGLPVLSNNPAPFSSLLGLSTLSRERSFVSVMFSELTSSDWSLSSAFGQKMLSDEPAPLSSAFNIKTLSEQKGEWTTSCGMPLLSSEAAPLSSKLGMSTLTSEAAPLSSAFGMPTLTKRQ